MEAGIGKLLQHEVGYIGAGYAEGARWQGVGQDAVFAG